MSFLDDLEALEIEPTNAEKIVDAMARGLSHDAMAGLLSMTQEEFAELAEQDEDISRALLVGEAKAALYLERLALVSASSNSSVLLSILRTRLGWDNKDGQQGSTLIVEVKKFLNASEGEKDTDPA